MVSNEMFVTPVLKTDFREFCVNHLVLRQIDDVFTMAGVQQAELPPSIQVSGQRRTLVEQYYAGIDWASESDVSKFFAVLGYTLAQTYLEEKEVEYLRNIILRDGLEINGIHISLPSQIAGQNSNETSGTEPSLETLAELKHRLVSLSEFSPHKRGFEFERFLVELFGAFGLDPRGSFRLQGEQIDGSFECYSATYLLEAKWHSAQTSQSDLLIFREKVESKSSWSRGLFVSVSGFTPDGLSAFSRGRATNIIGMTGQDIYFILDGQMSLPDAISQKARYAAETGAFLITVFDMIRE